MQLTAWIGFRDQLPRQAPRAAFCPLPTCYPNFARRPLSGEPVQPAESSWEASLTQKACLAHFRSRNRPALPNEADPERISMGPKSGPLPTEAQALDPPREDPGFARRRPENRSLHRIPSQSILPVRQTKNQSVKPTSCPLWRSNSQKG